MSDLGAEAAAAGRPTAGQALAQTLDEAAERRPKSRNVRALGRLIPFAAGHRLDAAAAGVFLVTAAAASLGLTGAIRLLADHVTQAVAAHATARSVEPWFWALGGVALALALSSALRYFFVTKLGERVVADLRKATYAHILSLDPAFFLMTRTGEVLSRLTTDIQIVENLLTTSISVSLRNVLMLIGGLAYMLVVSPRLTGLVLVTVPLIIAPLFLFGRRVRKLTASTRTSSPRPSAMPARRWTRWRSSRPSGARPRARRGSARLSRRPSRPRFGGWPHARA
ncbi:MAG: transporter, HlyB/MsbA family [Phenylobacterium sp.]|nr:transporter, HlyB/MsbA family [Phenylobacterium sp.]